MKVFTMLVAAGFIFGTSGAFAEGTHSDNTSTETSSKASHKKHMGKGKKVKPLTEAEKKELHQMEDTSMPKSEPNPAEATQAK